MQLPIMVFEGFDKSGKTTLIKKIAKLTNFKYICIDRATVGFKTYNFILNKQHTESDYDILEQQLLNIPHLMIYCRPSPEIILRRLREHGEQILEGVSIEEALSVYDRYYDKSFLNKIELDTGMSIDHCVNVIISTLEHMDSRTVIDKLSESMRVRESYIGMIAYHPVHLTLTDEDFIGVPFDYDVDSLYYDMVAGHINHIMHKRNIGLINDRQMIYVSSDCISMIQIDIASDGFLVHVHQRSLNMAKHAHNDICVIFSILKMIDHPNKFRRVKINYCIAFPHYVVGKDHVYEQYNKR